MNFFIPTRIVFEPGAVFKIKDQIEESIEGDRIFVVTDKGVKTAGIVEKIISQFEHVYLFDEVESNPKHTTVNRGGDIIRDLKADMVIGVGGGSSLDAAKAIALLAKNKGKIENYEGKEKYDSPPLPFVAVPTTCGTGSEVTWVSVITHTERRFKMSIKGPDMFPELAVIDPDLLVSLPKNLIASTGLDALTHAVEAYTVKPATIFTDIFALKAISLIFDSLEKAYNDIKENKEARENLMLGSTLAGIAFGNSDVGSVHCIAESIGSLYDIPHGIANSVFLPLVMEFNLEDCKKKYAHIGKIAGFERRSDEDTSRELIRKIKALSLRLGIPSFSELGIPQSRFSEIARKSFENNSNSSNPSEATEKDYMMILRKACEQEE
ncbi:MAG: iron-containing alcohol dehydrogenase [Candidatus Aminicenantaceae bacterium]